MAGYPKKTITVIIPGAKGSERKQTMHIEHHETVLDILKFNKQTTDGSLGIKFMSKVYDLGEQLYPYIVDNAVVRVVPFEETHA